MPNPKQQLNNLQQPPSPIKTKQSLEDDVISSDSISVISDEKQLQPPVFEKHTYSYIMLVLSCLFWVAGFIYSNQHNLSPYETNLSRYTFMIFVTYIHCRMDGSSLVFFNRPHEKTLLFRNVVVCMHGFIVSLMQFYLPLSIVHTLVISGQIFIFLANYLIKGVKITKKQAIGVFVSFIGLGLIINGRYMYEYFFQSGQFHSDFSNYHANDTATQVKMAFLLVLWNAVWAVSVVITKLPEYSVSEILFTQSVISMLIGAVGYVLYDSDSHVTFDTYWPSLFTCSLIMIANYLFTYGIMWSTNTGISGMAFMSNGVFGYFISIYRYNERINSISIFGTVLLVLSAGYVIWEQQRNNK